MPPGVSSESAIDPALSELTSVLGGQMAREAVGVFLQTFPRMLHELGQSDSERSRRAAHGLKSSARQMGAVALADLMVDFEKRLGAPDAKMTQADIAAVIAAFSSAAGPLRAFARSRAT
jgi:HPt (histidine-containing phosphotransfer) domain-containing protein